MVFDWQIVDLTHEEWLRRVQRLSRKELLHLCIEQDKLRQVLMNEKTLLLRDLAYAKRKIGDEWISDWQKYKAENKMKAKCEEYNKQLKRAFNFREENLEVIK